MSAWKRTPVVPGDRLTVEIQYSNRSVLRPLIGLLREVAVLDHARAVILNEDGSRYAVRGRPLPPVALVQVSIFTNPVTGAMWAQAYQLPPRDRSPYPVPSRYAAIAEPDSRGGIASMHSCWCGGGCRCRTCGEQTVEVPRPAAWNGRPDPGPPGDTANMGVQWWPAPRPRRRHSRSDQTVARYR